MQNDANLVTTVFSSRQGIEILLLLYCYPKHTENHHPLLLNVNINYRSNCLFISASNTFLNFGFPNLGTFVNICFIAILSYK